MPITERLPLHFALEPSAHKGDCDDPIVEMVTELIGRLQQLVTFTSDGSTVHVNGFVIKNYRNGRSKEYAVPEAGWLSEADRVVGAQPMKSKRSVKDGKAEEDS